MNDAQALPSLTLRFCEGSSDKVYQAQIVPQGEGYVVNFQYGRYGTALQTGCKTPVPVTLEAAKKVFSKLASEKKSKGYTENGSGTAYQDTDNEQRVSGFLPQLLNPIEPDEAKGLLIDSSWCMQQKHDGVRCMLRVLCGEVTGINRKGLTVPLPRAVVDAAQGMPGRNDFVLDGELVGETLHVFDILRNDGTDTTSLPLSARLAILDAYTDTGAVRRVATYKTREQKAQALEQFRANGAEGVVFKKLASPYRAGRPNALGDALKLKFVASASVRVRTINAGKRSVGMELLDASGAWVDVGNVTIPPNHAIPAVADILEVAYLYAFRGGSLFQPVLLAKRADIEVADCTTAQLQFKGEDRAAA